MTARCRSPRHLGRKLGSRLGSAGRTAQPVQAMLAHRHCDRGQLADLMTLRRGSLDAFLIAEGTRARAAALGPVIDDLVHLLERQQGPALARVAGLSAGPPGRGRLTRPRRRRGRVGRGRQRGVVRVAAQALLEIGDATLKPPVRLDQLGGLHEQGDRHLPVAIKDRLRLGAFHDPRLRRAEAGPFYPSLTGT